MEGRRAGREHHPLAGIGRGLGDEPLGVADAFGGDENALGIHAGKNVAKALALHADQVIGRHAHVLEEHFGRGVVHHGADGADGQAFAFDLAHVDQKDG